MKKLTALDLAEKLADRKYQVEFETELHKKAMAPIQAEIEILEGELLAELKKMPPATRLGTSAGISFTRSVKTTFDVVDEKLAFSFAIKNGLLRIDKTAANKKLLRTVTTPEGFERKESDFLSVSGLKKKKDEQAE